MSKGFPLVSFPAGAVFVAIALVALTACSSGARPTSTKSPTSAPLGAQATQGPPSTGTPTEQYVPTPTPFGMVTVTLVAQNASFNLSTVSVPSGSPVSLMFINKDAGATYNFSIYRSLPGGGISPMFVGPNVTGPATKEVYFDPLPPGTYLFQCDSHPQTMHGKFVVAP